jgi:hypothetical protein
MHTEISEELREKMRRNADIEAEKYWNSVVTEREILHKYHKITESLKVLYSTIETNIEDMFKTQISSCLLELWDSIRLLRASFENFLDYMETVSVLDEKKKAFEKSKRSEKVC